MSRFWLSMLLAAPPFAGGPLYELSGRMAPAERAMVSLFGDTAPFQAATESDAGGRYRFRNLRAGTYTIAIYVAGRGEARQTAEVGPGTADAQRRVTLDLQFKESGSNRLARGFGATRFSSPDFVRKDRICKLY
jgi:hypothetical protein